MAFQRTDATLRWLRTPPARLAPIRNNGDGVSAFCWIRHTASGASPRVGWGANSAAEPRIVANNNNGVLRGLHAETGQTLITGTTTAGLNTWFPIAVSYRMSGGNGNVRAVGNQVLLTATPAARAATEALVQFTVGQDPGDNVVTDTGEFAHAAAWNVGLSDDEMQALNRGANPLRIRPGNLVGYWPLDGDGRNLARPIWPLNPAGSATSAPVWVAGPPGIEPPRGRPIWLYAAPAAGGSVYNDTISDSVTGADTVTALATVQPSTSDTATSADTVAGAATVRPSISDTAAGSDSLSVSVTVRPAISDTVTGGDTAAGSIGGAGTTYSDTITDTLFASDVADALSGGTVIIVPLPVTPPPPPGRRRMRFLEPPAVQPEEPEAPEPTGSGNTLLPPPRRSGRDFDDVTQMFDWMQGLYEAYALETNVLGTIEALTQSQARAEGRLAAAEAKLKAIGDLVQLAGPISGTYDAAQLADAFNKINAIIVGAKG